MHMTAYNNMRLCGTDSQTIVVNHVMIFYGGMLSDTVDPRSRSDESSVKICHVILFHVALKQLHGAGFCDAERDDIEKEKLNTSGVQAKKPWELFTDCSLRWQLLTIILLNAAQQLNGINAVRPRNAISAPHLW